MSDLKERIAEKVKEFQYKKKKEFGGKHIPGVTKPKKQEAKENKPKKDEKPKKHKVKTVGPRGGVYTATQQAKKQYIKKALQEVVLESEKKYNEFVQSFKRRK